MLNTFITLKYLLEAENSYSYQQSHVYFTFPVGTSDIWINILTCDLIHLLHPSIQKEIIIHSARPSCYYKLNVIIEHTFVSSIIQAGHIYPVWWKLVYLWKVITYLEVTEAQCDRPSFWCKMQAIKVMWFRVMLVDGYFKLWSFLPFMLPFCVLSYKIQFEVSLGLWLTKVVMMVWVIIII